MLFLEYYWLHIPSNTRERRTSQFEDFEKFYRQIAIWNGSAPGKWQYWLAY